MLAQKIKENINVDDTFSTMTKLLKCVGFPATKSQNSKKAQIKELSRYIDIGKTHKINTKTKKQSNEIVILDIYEEPLNKQDKRYNEGSQEIINEIKKLIYQLGQFQISYNKLISENIIDIKSINNNNDSCVIYYRTYLFDHLKGKINSALRQLVKEQQGFIWQYTYVVKYKDDVAWYTLTEKDVEYVNNMKDIIKAKILLKHNNKMPHSKKANKWKDIAFRYYGLVNKQLNQDLEGFKNIEQIYKVVCSNGAIQPTTLYNNAIIYNYISNIMQGYIDNPNKQKVINNSVIEVHNSLFPKSTN